MKQLSFLIIGLISIACVSSCNTYRYKITTRISPDGKSERSMYEITSADTLLPRFMDDFSSVNEMNHRFRMDSTSWKKILPSEALKKRFKWFYTYYTYTAIYPEIKEKGRIPLDNFLNKEEQALWLRGDLSAYQGMNGVELKSVMDQVEAKFEEWLCRSIYENSFSIFMRFVIKYDSDERYQEILSLKDSLFLQEGTQSYQNAISIAERIDKCYQTDFFSKLYESHREEIEYLEEEEGKTIELFDTTIEYELILPGKTVAANTTLTRGDVLVWKVSAYHFLAGDYTLTATSRQPNIGILLLSAFFIAGCVVFILRPIRKRR